MAADEFDNKIDKLANNLRQVMFYLPIPQDKAEDKEFTELFNNICKSVVSHDFYHEIWEERILLQLFELFHYKPPNETIYGQPLAVIRQRTELVAKINDFFFAVLCDELTSDVVSKRLFALIDNNSVAQHVPNISYALEQIRSSTERSSVKLATFLNELKAETCIDLGMVQEAINNVLSTIQRQENLMGINALLVNSSTKCGTVIPLRVNLRSGKGSVTCLIPSGDEFQKAIERARAALLEGNFLQNTTDVEYTLEITDARYNGGSIGLPATVAMYSAKSPYLVDPFTAFTGDINFEGGKYKVKGVSGIRQKIDAAVLNGCRRVFLPAENSHELTSTDTGKLVIHCVDDILEVFKKLQKHVIPVGGDSVLDKKIAALKAYCLKKGWVLSPAKNIQSGFQFVIAPIEPPELKLNIYTSGTHVPKSSEHTHFQKLLDHLNDCDNRRIQIRPVQQVFVIKDTVLRSQIQNGLGKLKPVKSNKEQYCEYSYEYIDGKEKLIVKQFTSGKLNIQGSAGELYKKVLEIVVGNYNTKYPTAQLSVENYLENAKPKEKNYGAHAVSKQKVKLEFPHIGTDESGKGDYFGPLVSAGVLVTERTAKKLLSVGVRDSKRLSDKRNLSLAQEILKICRGNFSIIEISPDRYNKLYQQFKREKKSLNTLLAWGHAKAIEEILVRVNCKTAVADQFADESFILSKLQERGKQIELIQMHKAEQNVAVAAASILARARFLEKLAKFSKEYGIDFPKGASQKVIDCARKCVELHGKDSLSKVAKLHFKTTNSVIS